MTTFKWFASLVFASTIVPALAAKVHCPGNVASVPLRTLNRHQNVLAVSINHTGLYNFLLDSGAQMTIIDPSLVAELNLKTEGAVVIAGVGSNKSGSFAQLDVVEVGSHAVSQQKAVVYTLKNLYSGDLHIQGVLGEDFFERFDMLIDNEHSLLCLDNSAAMRAEVKGPRIPLLVAAEPEHDASLPGLLLVDVHLSGGTRPVRLMLDSGANVSLLYNCSDYLPTKLSQSVLLSGSGMDGAQRIFWTLPPQDVKIGTLKLSGVHFFSLAGTQRDGLVKGFDGILAIGLFRRVFIDHSDHFAILEPR